MEVVDGRLPKDRIALRELYNEILGWPWLEAEEDQTDGTGEAVANYEAITPGMQAQGTRLHLRLSGQYGGLSTYSHAIGDRLLPDRL